jgi:biotin carboxyl carrier protein
MSSVTQTPPSLLKFSIYLKIILVMAVLAMLLPWEQFSSGTGHVIALDPNERFQEIHAPVSGFVRRWHVREGSWVRAGEPLVSLSDTDADLIGRLELERKAAEEALASAQLALKTGRINLDRQKKLFEQGLVARKDWEKERIDVSKYEMEVSKAQATLAKAQREVARQETQSVVAPRDGWVVRVRSGEGAQIVKSGDSLLVLAPKTENLAAEIWVNANDVALIKAGSKALLEFAGWPAIQSPGWPATSVGTFKAKVVLVDAVASKGGKFRVLLVPDEKWPSELFVRQGARTSGFIRLSVVRLGWEVWRQFNGMPADISPIQDELQRLLEVKAPSKDSKSDKKDDK